MSEQSLIFNSQDHSYYLGSKKLISVSKIINQFLGSSYEGVSREVLEKAKIRGLWVHKSLELYLNNFNKKNIIENILTKIKPLIITDFEKTYELCEKALNNFNNEFVTKKEDEFIVEKPIYFKNIAGTPDLILIKKNINQNWLVDYKTYSYFTKELKEKTLLQLTAYYWILNNQGIQLSKTAYVYWVSNYKSIR